MTGRYVTSGEYAVRIDGLKPFVVELRVANPKLVRDMQFANYDAASLIKDKAAANAASLGGVAAKAAQSLGASKSALRAMVKLGGKRYPFAFGAEFGARPNKKRGPYQRHGKTIYMQGWNQFNRWRGNQWTDVPGPGVGYFLYPAVRQDWTLIRAAYLKRVDSIYREAFPDGAHGGSS